MIEFKKIAGVIMQKKLFLLLFLIATPITMLSASTNGCDYKYMHDSCAIDRYDIVQSERYSRGVHNEMYIVHHFNDQKRAYRSCHIRSYPPKRAHHVRRYTHHSRCALSVRKHHLHHKNIKKCRWTKI